MINDCTHPPGFCVAIEPQATNCQRTIVAQSRLQQYLPAAELQTTTSTQPHVQRHDDLARLPANIAHRRMRTA